MFAKLHLIIIQQFQYFLHRLFFSSPFLDPWKNLRCTNVKQWIKHLKLRHLSWWNVFVRYLICCDLKTRPITKLLLSEKGERERERERNMCSLSLCSRTNKFPSETTFSGTDLLLSAVKTFYTETSKTVRKKLLASFPKSYME